MVLTLILATGSVTSTFDATLAFYSKLIAREAQLKLVYE